MWDTYDDDIPLPGPAKSKARATNGLAGARKGGFSVEKLRTDYRESDVQGGEKYERVEDYDPVLRPHCRPDEPVPKKAEAEGLLHTE